MNVVMTDYVPYLNILIRNGYKVTSLQLKFVKAMCEYGNYCESRLFENCKSVESESVITPVGFLEGLLDEVRTCGWKGLVLENDDILD
jgi:hypothetical protein